MLLAGLLAFCVFSVNMRATLQLPPPWHRTLERRLDSLERSFAEEKNKLWMEIYSMSSKRDEDVSEMSNSSVEFKESQVVTDAESSDTEQKMEKDSGDIDAFLKGLRDEKKYVRDFINKAEQQQKRTQQDLLDRMESMDTRMSKQIIEGYNFVSSQLADIRNTTLHVREITENLEYIVKHIQTEVSGLTEKMVWFHRNCGSWAAFQGSCYFVSHKLLTWEEARESCHATGAYLAEVDSEEEAAFMINLAKSAGSVGYGPWLGASDTNSEGDWVWQSSGRRLSDGFIDWAFNEPNGGTVENCLHMYNSDVYLFHWIDNRCTLTTNFICEK